MKESWLAIGLIICLGVIAYANSFSNPFIWDDHNLIVSNPYIRNIRLFKHIFTKDLAYGTQFSNFYRPLQTLSFAWDYYLWGLNPFGYHLSNLFLHLGSALLIYFLGRLLFPTLKYTPLVSALLFLVHPIHTEAVTYISGRAEPLMNLFILLALISYIKHDRQLPPKNLFFLLAAVVCFLLALLSKEAALVAPLFILLYDVSLAPAGKSLRDKLKFRYPPFLLVGLIYILLRVSVFNFKQQPLFAYDTGLYLRLLTSAKIFAYYLGLLILPLHLHMERSLPTVSSVWERDVYLSLILFLLLGILIIRSYRYSRRCFFGLIWFFLGLLPVANIIPLGANMAEHWLYFPAIGLFLCIAFGTDKLLRMKRAVRLVTAISLIMLICFYSFLTIRRNRDWRRPQEFFQSIISYVPHSAEAHNGLGAIYAQQGKLDLAVAEYKQAIALKPHNYKFFGNLGTAYRSKKEYALAISAYSAAIKLCPQIPGLYNNLGNVYSDQRQWQLAIESFRRALKLFPEFALCRVNLANVYFQTGDADSAIKEYRRAIALNPDYAPAYFNLGTIYQQRGEYDLATAKYKKALQINPAYHKAYLNLGTVCDLLGQTDEAMVYFRKALALQANFLAYHNLGVVYFRKQEFALAKENFLRSRQLNPRYNPTKKFIKELEKLGY